MKLLSKELEEPLKICVDKQIIYHSSRCEGFSKCNNKDNGNLMVHIHSWIRKQVG